MVTEGTEITGKNNTEGRRDGGANSNPHVTRRTGCYVGKELDIPPTFSNSRFRRTCCTAQRNTRRSRCSKSGPLVPREPQCDSMRGRLPPRQHHRRPPLLCSVKVIDF